MPAGDMFGEPLPIHKQTCYFFGRERRVADIPTDHPSCSKQHAILQYRSAARTMCVSPLRKTCNIEQTFCMDTSSVQLM